jgi:hypothetical protein
MTLNNFRLAASTYFDIGLGLLPFSITPVEATSSQSHALLVTDRIRADIFDFGADPADPESGAIGPSEVARLLNLSGYIPQIWT